MNNRITNVEVINILNLTALLSCEERGKPAIAGWGEFYYYEINISFFYIGIYEVFFTFVFGIFNLDIPFKNKDIESKKNLSHHKTKTYN